MSAEVDRFRLAVSESLLRMAEVEERLAKAAHPEDEVSVEWMHDHAATALREAARVIMEMGRE